MGERTLDKTADSLKQHGLYIENRRTLKLTGVEDVDYFDEQGVTAYTCCGCVNISGTSLHIEELRLDDGALFVTGEIDAVIYTSGDKKKKGFLKRVFSG